MKSSLLPRNIVPVALLAFAATVASQFTPPLHAQPESDPVQRPNQPPSAARRGPAGEPAGFRGGLGQGLPAIEQVLTADQRDSLRQTMDAQREKMRGLQEKIRAARKALLKAALAEEFKADAVQAKALEVAQLEAEVSVLRLKAFAEVQPALSPEQLEKILNPPQSQRLDRKDGGNRPPHRPADQRANRPPPPDAP